jgi:hypothetical protein
MLIDKYMPRYDQNEFHSRMVPAPASVCYPIVRKVDWSGSLSSYLFKTGTGLVNLVKSKPGPATGMDFKVFQQAGFWILEDNQEDEIIIGSYQRFTRKVDVERIPEPEEFIAYNEPGVYKIAWSIGVKAVGGKTRIHTETRVQCTDASTRRQFALYWFFIRPFSGLTRHDYLRAVSKQCLDAQQSKPEILRTSHA